MSDAIDKIKPSGTRPGGFAAVKAVINCFYFATLQPQVCHLRWHLRR